MGLNSNQERQAWWEEMNRRYTREEVEKAIATLKQDTQTVIRSHYEQKIPLKEIVLILKRSMTVVRSHQCMGIFKLSKYFEEYSQQHY